MDPISQPSMQQTGSICERTSHARASSNVSANGNAARLALALCALVCVMAPGDRATASQVYKCKGTDGSTVYQQSPCDPGRPDDGVVELPPEPSAREAAAARARAEAQAKWLRQRASGSGDPAGVDTTDDVQARPPSGWEREELLRRIAHREASLAAIKGWTQYDKDSRARLREEIAELRDRLNGLE